MTSTRTVQMTSVRRVPNLVSWTWLLLVNATTIAQAFNMAMMRKSHASLWRWTGLVPVIVSVWCVQGYKIALVFSIHPGTFRSVTSCWKRQISHCPENKIVHATDKDIFLQNKNILENLGKIEFQGLSTFFVQWLYVIVLFVCFFSLFFFFSLSLLFTLVGIQLGPWT